MDDTGPENGRPGATTAPHDDPRSARDSTDGKRRSRWLAAALVGAAAPTAVVPVAHAAAPGAVSAQVSTATPAAAGSATRTATPAAAAAAAAEQVVTVERGDTVGAIAARTGSSVEAIVAANGLDGRASIVEGQELRVPAAGAAGGADQTPAGDYTVVRGDTLTSISATTGVGVGDLREANGLAADGFIREGQVLRLSTGSPAAAPTSTGSSTGGTYTVRAGDTLSRIAAAHGTSVDALVSANDLDATGFIVEGQELDLGAGATPPATEQAAPAQTEQASSLDGAVEANRGRLTGADLPSRDEMREIIRSTAVRLGVDPSLALAVGYQESGFNMAVVSHANAIGAMQVIPSSGDWASHLLGEDIDLFDPRDNAKAGVAILRSLVANNPPDVAIASYYQGQASVRSRGMYDDTRRYVANVQTLQARFQ